MAANKTLQGQVAVVTGGGRGIGREIAQALALAGAKVAVTARSRDQLDETVALIVQDGGDAAALEMDVTDPAQVKKTFANIEAHFGPVDVLVNNAGVGATGNLPWEADIDTWWQTLEVNIRGVYLCSRAVVPGMIARGRGRLINVGSNAAFYAPPDASEYSVSKAALVRLTETFAVAAGDSGVVAFTISPGLVLTDMTRDVPVFKDLPPSEWTPIEKAGQLCVKLASGIADKLTGRYIHVSDDDVDDLIARAGEIVEKDLNAMRLQR